MYARVMTTQNVEVPEGTDDPGLPVTQDQHLEHSKLINRLANLTGKNTDLLLILSADYRERNSWGTRVYEFAKGFFLWFLVGQYVIELVRKVIS